MRPGATSLLPAIAAAQTRGARRRRIGVTRARGRRRAPRRGGGGPACGRPPPSAGPGGTGGRVPGFGGSGPRAAGRVAGLNRGTQPRVAGCVAPRAGRAVRCGKEQGRARGAAQRRLRRLGGAGFICVQSRARQGGRRGAGATERAVASKQQRSGPRAGRRHARPEKRPRESNRLNRPPAASRAAGLQAVACGLPVSSLERQWRRPRPVAGGKAPHAKPAPRAARGRAAWAGGWPQARARVATVWLAARRPRGAAGAPVAALWPRPDG